MVDSGGYLMLWRPDQDCKYRALDHEQAPSVFLDDGGGWPLYAISKLVKFLGENARARGYSCALVIILAYISSGEPLVTIDLYDSALGFGQC